MRAFLFAEDGVYAGLYDVCWHGGVDDKNVGAEIRRGWACGCGSGWERSDETRSAKSFEKRPARVVQGWPPQYMLRNRRSVVRAQSGSATGLGQVNPWLNRPHSIARNAVIVSRPTAGSADSGASRAIAPLCRT